jgi:hypothetical protein
LVEEKLTVGVVDVYVLNFLSRGAAVGAGLQVALWVEAVRMVLGSVNVVTFPLPVTAIGMDPDNFGIARHHLLFDQRMSAGIVKVVDCAACAVRFYSAQPIPVVLLA